jgi:Ner family transcriptional regulator
MPKKQPLKKDWHKADIIAAVHKTGTSLRQMSRKLGLAHSALKNALHCPAPRYERLIAERISQTPQQIWPSRYNEDGSPKSGRGERGLGRYKAKYKFNAADKNSNVNRDDIREVA